MRVLDIFSGIGGFSLGLERAGMRTVAFCEIEPFCRSVLRKHWPAVPVYDDVRTISAERLRADGIDPEVICGGFPCQDISSAGKQAGIEGERSGLWREYARLIGEIRPRYAIVENVSALLNRGLDKVLGDLATLGFDAEWHCIPASAVGAPHRRDRVWIVAYPATGGDGFDGRRQARQGQPDTQGEALANAAGERCGEAGQYRQRLSERPASCSASLAHPDCTGLQDGRQPGQSARASEAIRGMAFAELERCSGAWWAIEPDVGRVAHGIPGRVDRLRALGNAVVPQIPEIIGRAIMAAELSQ